VFEPLPALTAELEAKRVAAEQKKASGKPQETAEKPKLVPFYAAIQASTLEAKSDPEVTVLTPEAKERVHAGGTHATANAPVPTSPETAGEATQPVTAATPRPKKHARSKRHKQEQDPMSLSGAVSGRW
jgi:hypothetical protein